MSEGNTGALDLMTPAARAAREAFYACGTDDWRSWEAAAKAAIGAQEQPAPNGKTGGQLARDAFVARDRSVPPLPFTPWDELAQEYRDDWEAIAQAVESRQNRIARESCGELARQIELAWDREFTHAPASVVDHRMAVIAAETVRTAVTAREPAPGPDGKPLAQLAYEAFFAAFGWDVPAWPPAGLEGIRKGWEAAAQAVRQALDPS